MKEYDLNKLINNEEFLNKEIKRFSDEEVLRKQVQDTDEIQGHMLKADHNLRFVAENSKLGFNDWVITGCYYACYHAALALLLTKGYSSKNHLATVCVLIKEFYGKELNEEDITTLSTLLDYQDVLFYVE